MITILTTLGVYFKFQKVCGDFILDFYLPEVNVNIETDGMAFHKDRKQEDRARDKWLRRKGLRVIRFKAWQFDKKPELIEQRILALFPQPNDYLTEEFKRTLL